MKIELANEREAWDGYVAAVAPDNVYHRWAWREVIERTFGHRPFYLAAIEGGAVRGVLPLVQIRSGIFGNFLVSMPYCSYGGILADSDSACESLLARAVELASELDARHIELRQGEAHRIPWKSSAHKVTMEIKLPASADEYWRRLSSGMRNKIRQGQKHNLHAQWNGANALESFYEIFAVNMRNLGTPVYSRQFFENQISQMPGRIRILTIRDDATPVAAAFITAHQQTLELPWSASLPEWRKKYSQVLMYWTLIRKAIEEGFRKVDLGRCTYSSGTYEFKRHWNPAERPLNWYYWLAPGVPMPQLGPDSPKFKLASRIWQHLPLAVANGLGPRVVRSLP